MTRPRYVPVSVPDLALEVSLITDGDDALKFLHGLVRGLAGKKNPGAEKGNDFGFDAYLSNLEWRKSKVHL